MYELKYPVVLDGATGTELQKRGMPAGCCAEQWSLEHPEAPLELQRGYAEAGSGIIYAPTFTANRLSLDRYGFGDSVEDFNTRLVAIAKRAAGGHSLIGGDISPTGKQLEPYGELTMEELIDVYAEQAAALDSAGVDLFAVETQVYIGEARAAFLGVRRVTDKPIFVSFTMGAGGKTLYGGELLAALVTLQSMGAAAFGVNCASEIDVLCEQIELLSRYAHIPLIAKPNAGLPEYEDGRSVYRLPPEELGSWAAKLYKSGARLIGGCCGTGPAHIAAVSAALKAFDGKLPVCEAAEMVAGEKHAYSMPVSWTELECDDDLEDAAEDAAESGAEALRLNISDEEALECFIDTAPSIDLPVVISAAAPELMEKALLHYNGRALVVGGGLDRELLHTMSARYGAILTD